MAIDYPNVAAASTNTSVISLALQSQDVNRAVADAIAAGACRSFELGQSVNEGFLLSSAYLVFLMQAGFAMVRKEMQQPAPHDEYPSINLNMISSSASAAFIPFPISVTPRFRTAALRGLCPVEEYHEHIA